MIDTHVMKEPGRYKSGYAIEIDVWAVMSKLFLLYSVTGSSLLKIAFRQELRPSRI